MSNYTGLQYKKFYEGTPGAGIVTVYTCPVNYQDAIRDIMLDNTGGGGTPSVSIYIIPSGQTVSSANILLYNYQIAPAGYLHWTGLQVLNGGDSIAIAVTVAGGTSITAMMSGWEFTTTAAPPPPPPPPTLTPVYGTNLSGMEWGNTAVRYSPLTPYINYGIPRKNDINYYASLGMTRLRLPVMWELLQPIMSDRTGVDVSVTNALGQPGTFNGHYQAMIQSVLDGAAAANVKIILDLHNYCRYQDFIYQSNGTVTGFTVPTDSYVSPYTTNNTQVVVRVFANTAVQNGSTTISQTAYQNVWTQIAGLWKTHAGLGGYGLMNEPHDMPTSTGTTPWNNPYVAGNVEDYTIWGNFAQAAINAIRAVDTSNPIYVSNEEWSSPIDLTNSTINPYVPYTGTNLVYEVHAYGDHNSSGAWFDWNYEVSLGTSVGETGSINTNTIVNRLTYATNWNATRNLALAWDEGGMPIDLTDGGSNWRTQFQNACNFAVSKGISYFSWMGGNHWPIHNYAINCTPEWHQNTTLEPLVAGVQKTAASITGYTLFDCTTAYSTGGAVTVYVFARGNVGSAINIIVSSNNGGTFSKTSLTIPSGANGMDSFTFTPVANSVTTISYSGSGQLPAARKIYSLTSPTTYSPLADGAQCILAKYNASCWIMNDAYTDYYGGATCTSGTKLRAVQDRGYGGSAATSGPVNFFGMINWFNDDLTTTSLANPMFVGTCTVLTSTNKALNLMTYNGVGLWCKKTTPNANAANSQPAPDNLALFNVSDPHFQIVAMQTSGTAANGTAIHSGVAEGNARAELNIVNGVPTAKWIDGSSVTTTITSSGGAPAANTSFSATMTYAAGAQLLRVNGTSVGTATVTNAAAVFNQHMIGFGWPNYYPTTGIGQMICGVIMGKGSPTTAELTVLENYLMANA